MMNAQGTPPSDQQLDMDLINSIIPHAFLTPRTPDAIQENLPFLESSMLHLASKTISSISASFPLKLTPLNQMFESWISLQAASSPSEFVDKFTEIVPQLKIGETISLYLRSQNAGLSFTNLDDKHTIVQTIQCMFPSDIIMSNVTPLVATFPHSIDAVINKGVLHSETFARHLFELSTTKFKCCIPKCSKAGREYLEHREVIDPFLVTDWIVGVLCPVEADIGKSEGFGSVKKKIRDEVSLKHSAQSIPFRRSGMWTCIKVATQLKVAGMFASEDEAKVIYKLIMLHILTTICSKSTPNDLAISSQMLAKIGRRTEKLRRIKVSEKSFAFKLNNFILTFVDAAVSEINNQMDTLWKLECDKRENILPILQQEMELYSNFCHSIPKLDALIATPMAKMSTVKKTADQLFQNPSSDLRASVDLKRYQTLDSCLASFESNFNSRPAHFWLHDVESFIKNVTVYHGLSSQSIYTLFEKYKCASTYSYKCAQDPVGMSQLVLCSLKLVQILDIIATNNYPLLLKYASGINKSAFDKLLLPYQDDMKLLEDILEYFKNRDSKAVYPAVFTSTQVSHQDFQVGYASADTGMICLRERILADTEQAIRTKYAEVTSTLEACKELRAKINLLGCECRYENRWSSFSNLYVRHKVSTCTRCHLESNLASLRHSVRIYERPLPPQISQQWAVLYELKIPNDLANLRDGLASLNYSVLGQPVTNESPKVKWKEYNKLVRYDEKRQCAFYNLGSTVLSVEMTHYSRIQYPDVMSNEKEAFIVENGMNCVYFHSCVDINGVFKFEISNTSSPDREMYMPLQYVLDGMNINQNQVIADAYVCHRDMSLTEFEAFGWLRDGHRIQLRNLYAYVANSTLALDKEPVLQLIMQTLWKLGPKENGDRICHFEFTKNDAFTRDFLKVLNNVVDKNEHNYSNPLILLSVIVITTRIVELNSRILIQALDLLRKCRSVVDQWVTRIDESIEMQQNKSGKVDHSLKLKLLHVTICSAFTFNISSSINQMLTVDDMNHWFRTITRLYELAVQENCLTASSPFMRCIIKASLTVAFKLESKIAPFLSRLLKTLAVSKWNKANQCQNYSWNKSYHAPSCYYGTYVDYGTGFQHVLTFDYLQGIFLVDGFPQGVLPHGVVSHPLYKMYFQSHPLRVQRDSNNVFRTVTPFYSNNYEFTFHSNVVTIKEVHDKLTYQLLEPTLFTDTVANSFIDNYTHWLHSNKKRVLLRRKPVTDADYNKPFEFALEISRFEKTWTFEDTITNKSIMSIKSLGFEAICNALAPFEGSTFINVTKDKTTSMITTHLTRHRLTFCLIKDHFESVEYPNFQISQEQNLNTLVGLQNYLCLENQSAVRKQKVIIPHGNIRLTREDSDHQVTHIDIHGLHSPPYFTYDFDPILHRLKAQDSKVAWLYLAALHGATSSGVRDPFTGLTGTEMAVWILQSAIVWSSTPYNTTCLRILDTIQNFSPKRSYYGQGFNKGHNEDIGVTVWPEGLNDMAAYDGYVHIVNKLLDDSNSLASLHGGAVGGKLKRGNVSEKLEVRAYLRNVAFYNQCAGIKPLYFPEGYQNPTPVIAMKMQMRSNKTYDVRNLHWLTNSLWNGDKCFGGNLKSFLITYKQLGQFMSHESSFQKYSLAEFLSFDFRLNWLELYSHAISPQSKDKNEREAWNIFFAAMSYKQQCNYQLMNLYLILEYSDVVEFPPIPGNRFLNPSDNVYSNETIETSLQKAAIVYPSFTEWVREHYTMAWQEFTNVKSKNYNSMHNLQENYLPTYNYVKAKYEQECKVFISKTVKDLQLGDDWPYEQMPPEKVYTIKSSKFFNSAQQVFDIINTQLRTIYRNRKLLIFVQNVERTLNQVVKICSRHHITQERHIQLIKNSYKLLTPFQLDVTVMPYQLFEVNAQELFRCLNPDDIFYNCFPYIKRIYEENKKLPNIPLSVYCDPIILQNFIYNCLNAKSFQKRILHKTGVGIRVAPLNLLWYLKKTSNPTQFATCVGGLAVMWTHLQRQNRIAVFTEGGDAFSRELAREQENIGYANWIPKDHPEWILLQLELDMMIRPIQVQVAQQMMEMPNGQNGVMQLNMGEGKTSVIVPMLCATLAGDDSLVRVTVLKSIFATNLKILSFTIGGLLNQRVYIFPCRRDMQINAQILDSINTRLKTCLNSRGVILTLPEYRLSFRLKVYDEINKGNVDFGLKMMETEAWMRTYVRDMLDESDELLSVKYQLVYTVGTQIPIDGGDLRWKVCQRLLQLVQDFAPKMSTTFGSSVVEFNCQNRANHPEQFEHFRFLSDGCKSAFYERLVDGYLADVVMSSPDKATVKTFTADDNPSLEVHNRVHEITKHAGNLLNKILLLSGYIRHGILHLALTKRWRVEYGVDPNGHRLMAVPFRAKDVAAEKTEFGHPDLAIVVTHLSYYYSGLSDTQLNQCFESLKSKNSPGMIYSAWIQKLLQDQVPPFLSSYHGINLKDFHQRTCLFNLLRKHKSVIDFYLSEKIFPKESKQFPGKMSMSAWDLCHEKNRLPVSGFSGTNDSSVLLPLAISQQDLEQLAQTNVQMEQTLLKGENKGHLGLRMGVTCEEILTKMTQDGLRVLIDAGALMLELDNEQVASLWLTVDPRLEATVYFDKQNEILVKTRAAVGADYVADMRLEFSPFRTRLGACGVFLDDQHTRGTDLKFPTGSRACVTIGTRMKRDKLMQACMRMRKLGNGHSVSFYLSHEAFDKIMCGSQDKLQTSKIIAWVRANTRQFNDDGLVHWAMAGRNYAQKLAAEEQFERKQTSPTAGIVMGAQVLDEEVTLLEKLYGVYTQSELLVHVIPKLFDITKQKLVVNNKSRLIPDVEGLFDGICSSVVSRCEQFVPQKTHVCSALDEEQEKELEKEVEVEEEREVERPPKADWVTPSLHPNVELAVRNGAIRVMPGIVRISDVFSNVSFASKLQPDGWSVNVCASNDFATVIKPTWHWPSYGRTDLHLRPVEFVAVRIDAGSKTVQMLVLSPFEVNQLIPVFRQGTTSCTLHMFSMRRTESQDILINNPLLQVPSRGSQVDETEPALACLHLASGTLYFDSHPEAAAYARFLGLVPQPWCEEQRAAFENGMITRSGFLLPAFRKFPVNSIYCGVSLLSFQSEPGSLVNHILACRHTDKVNEVAHVIKLLDFLTLPF